MKQFLQIIKIQFTICNIMGGIRCASAGTLSLIISSATWLQAPSRPFPAFLRRDPGDAGAMKLKRKNSARLK